TEVSEPVAPEGAVVAHPVCQRLEALGPGAVVDVPALGAFSDQARLLQRLQMLRDGSLGHAAPSRQLDHADLAGLDDPLEDRPPGRNGERVHDGVDGDHGDQIVYTN